MNAETVRSFKEAIANAFWDLSYVTFCEKLGWQRDRYSEEKFKAFQELARRLGAFDAETLAKVLQ